MQVKIQPSVRMGTFLLIFLLTSEEAHADFIVKSVKLIINPKNEVQRGTNVSLNCLANVSYSKGSLYYSTYIFYKDYQPLLATSATDHIYFIPDARLVNSGKYKCAVVIEKQKEESSIQDLIVKGLQTPVLTVDKLTLTEGDDVTAICTAEGETGLLMFFFRDGPEELYSKFSKNHQVEQKLSLTRDTVNLFCYYSVSLGTTIAFSNNSNVISIKIKELKIKPVIKVEPSTDVTEGDNISISCTVDMLQQRNSELRIVLVHGHTTLMNMTQEDYTTFAKANDSGEYECISKMGVIRKFSSVNINVKELFSVPVLSINPAEVFEGEHFTVSCQINSFASDKIQRNELKYTIFRDNTSLLNDDRYSHIAGQATNGKYMCKAETNGIMKESWSVLFRAKVPVGKPFLTVVPIPGNIEEGHDVTLICGIPKGSPPISFRFYHSSSDTQLHTTTVQSNSSSYILKSVNRHHSGTYYCEAFNPAKDASKSNPITVIVSLAMWKKALIAAFCMLLVALLILFFVMRYKAKRGRETYSPPASQAAQMPDL